MKDGLKHGFFKCNMCDEIYFAHGVDVGCPTCESSDVTEIDMSAQKVYTCEKCKSNFLIEGTAPVICPHCAYPGAKDLTDPVNPQHYKRGDIEAIDAIKSSMSYEEYRGYLKGNCLKYIWRYDEKGGVEDLKKAIWYLNKLIDTIDE